MDISKIVKLPKDGNTFLFNTIYSKKNWKNKDEKDILSLVYKNTKSGRKTLIEIEEPTMEIYKLKDDVTLENRWYAIMELDNVIPVEVKYGSMLQEMYKLIDEENKYWSLLKARRKKELNNIYFDNRLYAGDMNIEDFYRLKSHEYFGDIQLNNTTKGYFDIEADIRLGTIDFKTGSGDAPINAITYIHGNNKQCYTLLLRNSDNPLIEEFENSIPEFIEELHDTFDEKFGVMNYNVAFFDDEVNLIKVLFQLIHKQKPDYLMAWNMGFDIPYILNRLEQMGIDPADILCHDDFQKKECYYVRDRNNYEIKKKTDHFICSGYTIYIDQMIQYAAVRKSQSNIDSYKLNYIGKVELDEEKLEYEGEIRDFPYKDYWNFVKYNIKDVLLQYGIEEKVKDLDTTQLRSYSNNTRMDKIFKETTLLYNVSYKAFYDYGFVFGNNVNAIIYNEERERLRKLGLLKKGKEKPKYKGAIVSNPLNLSPIGVTDALGRASRNIIDWIIDYDYTSLYPTIIRMFNIFINTLVGKVEILAKPTDRQLEYAFHLETYNLGTAFMEDFTTDESLFLMSKYFGLPKCCDLLNMLDDVLDDSVKKTKVSICKVSKKKKKKDRKRMKVTIRREI